MFLEQLAASALADGKLNTPMLRPSRPRCGHRLRTCTAPRLAQNKTPDMTFMCSEAAWIRSVGSSREVACHYASGPTTTCAGAHWLRAAPGSPSMA